MVALKNLVLASQSPRRKELFENLRIPFTVSPSDAEEVHPEGHKPSAIVIENAVRKAETIGSRFPDSFIIGADTIVWLENTVLTKPADFAEAKKFLNRLAGNTHTVYTGVVVLDSSSGRIESGYCATDVTFRPMSASDIDTYIRAIHPYDKAGGYAIQGFGSLVVEKINGCYFNVMGLPIHLVDTLLRRFNVSLYDYITL